MLADIYRAQVLEHARAPRNRHSLAKCDAFAEARNASCGDVLTLFIRFEGERVAECSFVGEGCAFSLASASLLTEFLKGKTRAEVCAVSEETIDMLFHTEIVLARKPCAYLVLSALKKVVGAW